LAAELFMGQGDLMSTGLVEQICVGQSCRSRMLCLFFSCAYLQPIMFWFTRSLSY